MNLDLKGGVNDSEPLSLSAVLVPSLETTGFHCFLPPGFLSLFIWSILLNKAREGHKMERRTVTFKSKEYELDTYGFLDPPDQWDEDFADGMAAVTGIYDGLTEDHWEIIRYLRRKFLVEGSVPVVVIACAENDIRLSRLRELFPAGYHRGACRIAGINFAFMSESNIWLTYETTPAVEAEHEVDDLGFLRDFEEWNERFARWVVRNWSLPEGLTEEHWTVIQFLRDFYRDTKNIPTLYEVCRSCNIELDDFSKLFPGGYHRGACRAAGLPLMV